MREITLAKRYTDEEMEPISGTLLDESAYDILHHRESQLADGGA